MKQVPVFICHGFLDSGKTSFILDTIANDGYKEQGTTLVIACEDGEIEYEPSFLKENNTQIVFLDDVSELNEANLNSLYKKYKPGRILIELNGMWDFAEVTMPKNFVIGQFVTFVDYTTFNTYFVNMRQMMVNMFKVSDVVVFTRCNDKSALQSYQTTLRLINGSTTYIVMDDTGNGEIAFEEPLPYDIEADEIVVNPEDFGRWYIDNFDNKERYLDKVISMKCMAFKSSKLDEHQFVAGRVVMTCCADDVQLFGHLVESDLGVNILDKDWINIKFKLVYRYSKEYDEEEAIIVPISIEVIPSLGEPILNLT